MANAYGAPYTVLDAARTALENNPDAQAKLHELNAAYEERSMVRGGLLPQVTLDASGGRDSSNRDAGDLEANRIGVGVTLTQNLFDGFRSQYELKRFGYAEWTRYYELLDTAENIVLETVRAYNDVLRYRELVRLAEDNYVQHRAVFEQIQQRVNSGVSRRVDLEQAAGRLALASSNLLTEQSNLHDVSTRFQRIVGILPPADLTEAPNLSGNAVKSAADILDQAQRNNPALKAANANVAAADAERESNKSSRWPSLDLRARSRTGKNEDFIDGRRTDNTVELVLNYKVFSGGADSARNRLYAERYNIAQDLRLKACRDMRQTVLIAYNDVQKLKQQLSYLDEHQLAIGKAREAYRQQFNIGQRTLLDLLDSENEYFESRRAYAQAQHDLALAFARTHAGSGQLLRTLGLEAPGSLPSHESDPGLNMSCPADAAVNMHSDLGALNARASALAANRSPAAAPAPKPAPAAPVKAVEIRADGLFELDRAQLHAEGGQQIDAIVKASGYSYAQLAQMPDLHISVIGHTDPTGSVTKNLTLSQARADATRNYLVSQGLPADRISAEGRGSSESKSGYKCFGSKGQAKTACYAKDRRVEILIATQKK